MTGPWTDIDTSKYIEVRGPLPLDPRDAFRVYDGTLLIVALRVSWRTANDAFALALPNAMSLAALLDQVPMDLGDGYTLRLYYTGR